MQEEEYKEMAARSQGSHTHNQVRKGTEIAKHGLKDICQETNNPQLTLVSTEAFHSPIIGIANQPWGARVLLHIPFPRPPCMGTGVERAHP